MSDLDPRSGEGAFAYEQRLKEEITRLRAQLAEAQARGEDWRDKADEAQREVDDLRGLDRHQELLNARREVERLKKVNQDATITSWNALRARCARLEKIQEAAEIFINAKKHVYGYGPGETFPLMNHPHASEWIKEWSALKAALAEGQK